MTLGVSTPATPPADTSDTLGAPYVERSGGVTAPPTELTLDWNALDESSRAHMDLQNSLAEYVLSLGVGPLSPKSSEPAFDIAWPYDDTIVVVEVKSANETNHRQQVRLGIGQVLEYAAILNDENPGDYRPVLLLGETPTDIDYLLATSSGVVVIGPEQFNELGLEELLPLGPSDE